MLKSLPFFLLQAMSGFHQLYLGLGGVLWRLVFFFLSFKFTAISTWAEGQVSGLGEDMLDHLIPYEFDGYPDHVVIGIVMRRP